MASKTDFFSRMFGCKTVYACIEPHFSDHVLISIDDIDILFFENRTAKCLTPPEKVRSSVPTCMDELFPSVR